MTWTWIPPDSDYNCSWTKRLPRFYVDGVSTKLYDGDVPEDTTNPTHNSDAHSGSYYFRHRSYIPEQGQFTGPDPRAELESNGPCNYLLARNNPLRYVDPEGLEELEIRGNRAYWVVEKEGWIWDKDIQRIYIGKVYRGTTTTIGLRQEFGGTIISKSKARRIVKGHSYLNLLSYSARKDWMRRAFAGHGTKRGRSLVSSAAKGAGEGARGGASITANTLTFGKTDEWNITNSDQYQGGGYTAARILSTGGRELLITAGTMGLGQLANAGRLGYYGSQAVRAGNIAMNTRNAYMGGKQVVGGIGRVAEGDNWGYAEAALGAVEVYTSTTDLARNVRAMRAAHAAHIAPKTGEPALPPEAWNKNAPRQVTPGTKTLEQTKYNPKTGQWEKSTVE